MSTISLEKAIFIVYEKSTFQLKHCLTFRAKSLNLGIGILMQAKLI